MADLFSNPMGLDGFEFVEFSAPDPTVLDKVFRALGFIAVAKHRSKDVTLYRQGDVNFIINNVRAISTARVISHGTRIAAIVAITSDVTLITLGTHAADRHITSPYHPCLHYCKHKDG